MFTRIIFLSLVTVLNCSFYAAAGPYRGDEVLEVFAEDEIQNRKLNELLNEFVPEVSRWRPAIPQKWGAHVHVTSEFVQEFKNVLNEHKIEHNIHIPDLQQIIDEENASNAIPGIAMPWERLSKRQKRNSNNDTVSSIVGKYATYEEIMSWMKELVNIFPDVVQIINIGKTYEGRDISLLKISFNDGEVSKPGVWLDGGTHAREWISPASVVYMIYRILSAYYGYTSEEQVVRSVDWYVLPVLNPDGYAFTYAPGGNRLWRKNRSQYGENAIDSHSNVYNMTCHGSDINRNYDYQWRQVDSATDPCWETYTGPYAASENETQAVMSFLLNNRDVIRGYLTIHSYGQYFFTRWSYSDQVQDPYMSETLAVVQEAVKAINDTHGVKYDAGTSPKLMYAFSGGSGDWAREKAGIKHAYEVEVRDKGALGFILPTDQIIPVGEELWAAVKVVTGYVKRDFPWVPKIAVPGATHALLAASTAGFQATSGFAASTTRIPTEGFPTAKSSTPGFPGPVTTKGFEAKTGSSSSSSTTVSTSAASEGVSTPKAEDFVANSAQSVMAGMFYKSNIVILVFSVMVVMRNWLISAS